MADYIPNKRVATSWYECHSDAELTFTARDIILEIASAAIRARGAFYIVLAGGGTPEPVYRSLVCSVTSWHCWHVYFGDERCVPRNQAGRNDRMANDAWLAHVPIPVKQVHSIPAELGPEAGAVEYNRLVSAAPLFDLVLLGLGDDGHTASLFPGRDLGADADSASVLPITKAPKPPAQRVTLSVRRLNESRQTMMLVAGAGKREALQALKKRRPIPAAAIRPLERLSIIYYMPQFRSRV